MTKASLAGLWMVLKYEGRYELGGPLANMGVDDVLNSKKNISAEFIILSFIMR